MKTIDENFNFEATGPSEYEFLFPEEENAKVGDFAYVKSWDGGITVRKENIGDEVEVETPKGGKLSIFGRVTFDQDKSKDKILRNRTWVALYADSLDRQKVDSWIKFLQDNLEKKQKKRNQA